MSFVKEELAMAELEDGDLVDSIYCFVALITMRNNRRAWKVEPSEPKLGLTFYVLITMARTALAVAFT